MYSLPPTVFTHKYARFIAYSRNFRLRADTVALQGILWYIYDE